MSNKILITPDGKVLTNGQGKAYQVSANLDSVTIVQDLEGSSVSAVPSQNAVKKAIEALGVVFNFKGSKLTYSELPTEDNKIGDVWYIQDEQVGYIWIDTPQLHWEPFGLPIIDLSGYATKADVAAEIAKLQTHIDVGSIKTRVDVEVRANSQQNYWYYPICKLPRSDGGNYASCIIKGRVGGWISDECDYVECLITNRGGVAFEVLNIRGGTKNNNEWSNSTDIVVYTNEADGNSAIVYFKCHGYFLFNVDISMYQAQIEYLFDKTYVTEPVGILATSLFTTPSRLEIVEGTGRINGNKILTAANISQDAGGSSTTNTISQSGIKQNFVPMITQIGLNCNTLYNTGIYSIQGGEGCPLDFQNTPINYGTLFVQAYRQHTGNLVPDFATQIFIPNGDNWANQLYYRTSKGDKWDLWQQVATVNDIPSVINNLTSTSTTSALSAAQGKALSESKVNNTGGTLTGDYYFNLRKSGMNRTTSLNGASIIIEDNTNKDNKTAITVFGVSSPEFTEKGVSLVNKYQAKLSTTQINNINDVPNKTLIKVKGTNKKVVELTGELQPQLDGKQDKLTAGKNITISGNTISATTEIDQAIIRNMIYPIGSIYLSVNSANPSTFIGGTWIQLENRFLLGAGSSYSNGTTGGSADAVVVSHNHSAEGLSFSGTVNQETVSNGSHTHSFTSNAIHVNSNSHTGSNFASASYESDGGTVYVSGSTNNTGGHTHKFTAEGTIGGSVAPNGVSGAGKNMPPYLVVYMWKRTA